MATDNCFTPLDNPDFTTFDPTTIGVDTNITPEAITSKSQPLAFDSDTGILNINRNVVLSTATIGDPDIVAHFTHPNMPGELVMTSCQVGGTFYSNNVIIGSGSAQLLCDDTGTYIYNNLSVSGNINNNNLTTALNSKATTAQLSTLNDVVSGKADQSTLLTDYYNKNQTDSLLQGKANSNNVYTKSQVDSELSQKANTTDLINKANVNDVYSKFEADLIFQTKADMNNYPTFDNIADLDTTINSLSTVYQSITNMSTYVTQGSLLNYITSGSLATYVTMGTLIDNYATQLDISTKVEQAFFESSILALNQSVYNNSVVYTNNQINGLSTVYQPLGSYQLVGNYLTNASTFQLAGNYLTNASLFQLSGNYLTNASLFQLSGNYLTDASVFQLAGNYITTLTGYNNALTSSSLFQLQGNYLTNASLFQLAGNYITTLTGYNNALTSSSLFQLQGNYLTNASLFQLAGNYLTDASTFQLAGNYLTNASTFQLAGNYLTDASKFQLSGNYLTNASLFQLAGNYLTNASLFQLAGNYLTNASTFQLAGNYLTDASKFQLPGNYLTNASLFQLSGNYLTDASTFQLVGNYLTNASLFQLSGNYLTSGSLTAYAPIASPSFTGAPKINTYDVALKPWVCFRYTAGVVANYGVATISSVNSNSNNGAFDVVFTPAHPSGTNYGLLATCRNAGGAANYVQSFLTSTGFRITTYALSTGTQTAYDFTVMTVQ